MPSRAATARSSRRSATSSRATCEADDLDAFLDRLRDGDPPDGQRLLRAAFTRYAQVASEPDPKARTELLLLANLEIGMHEQNRLQPEICEALDAPYITEEELGRRLCPGRRPRIQRAAAKLAAPGPGQARRTGPRADHRTR